MFCPTCGLKQATEESRFCSRCGLLLSGIIQVITNNGILPQTFYHQPEIQTNVLTVRKKGLKQSGLMILTGLILVPTLGVLSEIIGFNTFFIGLTAIITFWGGILRMIYALIFEGNETETLEQKTVKFYRKVFKKQTNYEALPPQQSIPVSDFSDNRQGMWRETSDLGQNK